MTTAPIQVRVTAIIEREDTLLLVKQTLPDGREWSLPGGTLMVKEALREACAREVLEETGLVVSIAGLLWIAERPNRTPPLIDIAFRCESTSGEIHLPTNEFESNPISDVQFVPKGQLQAYGFSQTFQDLALSNFSQQSPYAGHKSNLGL